MTREAVQAIAGAVALVVILCAAFLAIRSQGPDKAPQLSPRDAAVLRCDQTEHDIGHRAACWKRAYKEAGQP